MALYCGAAAALCRALRIGALCLLFVGFWLGQFVTEFARIRSVPVAWSVLVHVLDWARVEQAIAKRRFD